MATELRVQLTGKAEQAVYDISLREGCSRTDAVNRALQVWSAILLLKERGLTDLYMTDPATGQSVRVEIH